MSHLIWVPKKIIEPKDPMILTSGVKGFIRMKVIKPGIGTRIDTGWFPNMILNSGLDRLGVDAIPSNITQVGVGSGENAPDPNQTSLQSPVAWTTTSGPGNSRGYAGDWGEGTYHKYERIGRQFAEGAAAGVLAEIGFCRTGAAGQTDLTTRARITDGSGNPTTITVLSDEILQVVYEFRHYLLSDIIQGSMNLSGTDYDYSLTSSSNTSIDRANQTYPNSALGSGGNGASFNPIGEGPTGGSIGTRSASATLASYSQGTYHRDASWPFSLGQGNISGGIEILYQFDSSGFQWKALFDTPIPKDNTKLMTINMRFSWGRHEP